MRMGFVMLSLLIASLETAAAQQIQRLSWLGGCWEAVVFENLQHDFPQRIGYQRTGPNALLAWVEGSQKGQFRRIEFPYRRATCTGS